MRCFVSAGISAEMRRAVGGVGDALRASFPGGRWVVPGNLHLTLRFLGELTAAEVESAEKALPAACSGIAPFRISLHGLGAFPSEKRAKTLWVGVGTGSDALSRLAKQVAGAMAGLGREPESRQFVSHLTIARFRDPINAAKLEVFSHLKQTELGMCDINGIALMESRLVPAGPQYMVLREAPLG